MGQNLFARAYGGTDIDWSSSITQTADGGLAIAGETRSFGAGSYDLLVLKLSSTGGVEWARTYGGTDAELAYSITRTTDDEFAVTGQTLSFGAGNVDFLLIGLSSTGTLEWSKTFGRTSDEHAYSIALIPDGGFAVAVITNSLGAGNWDLLILKTGPDGNYEDCVQNCSPFTGFPSLSSSSPSVGADCTLSGATPDPTVGTPDLAVMDACPPADLPETDPRSAHGITCSPLPGGLLFASHEAMEIKIYSEDGRVIYSGNLEKGQNRINLEQGVYFWRACPASQAVPYRGKSVVR